MVETISCFLTAAYTEAGYMQAFLEKINPKYRFVQKIPNKIRKRKGTSKTINEKYNGLTGEGLIDQICCYLDNDRIKHEIRKSKAIVIEDDTDDRFAKLDEHEFGEYVRKTRERITEKLGNIVPVIFLYACPEIESWFIADWNNGFKAFFLDKERMGDLEWGTRGLIEHFFHRYVQDELLEGLNNPEDFSYIKPYRKISDELIRKIYQIGCSPIETMSNINDRDVVSIHNSKCLYYSKKKDGQNILKRIDPDEVSKDCRTFFLRGYCELKAL